MTDQFDALRKRAISTPPIVDLFGHEPDRMTRFVGQVGPLRADFSKQRISSDDLSALMDLAEAKDLAGWRARLFAGDAIVDVLL